jgi:low affinity Fe/Cu permease
MMEHIGFILFYLFAIVVLILHFNGTLEEYNLEWLLYILAVAVFPAVLYL